MISLALLILPTVILIATFALHCKDFVNKKVVGHIP